MVRGSLFLPTVVSQTLARARSGYPDYQSVFGATNMSRVILKQDSPLARGPLLHLRRCTTSLVRLSRPDMEGQDSHRRQ